MKIRNGFVSNSSSTSYVIKNVSDKIINLDEWLENVIKDCQSDNDWPKWCLSNDDMDLILCNEYWFCGQDSVMPGESITFEVSDQNYKQDRIDSLFWEICKDKNKVNRLYNIEISEINHTCLHFQKKKKPKKKS